MDANLAWFFERLELHADRPAVLRSGLALTYRQLRRLVDAWQRKWRVAGARPGEVVGLLGDESHEACAAMLAAWREGLIVAPLYSLAEDLHARCLSIAGARTVLTIREQLHHITLREPGRHELLDQLRATHEPGVVLFSSGSTGDPKAVLWSVCPLLERHRHAKPAPRTLVFLRLDHIGGLNTIGYSLAAGGTLVLAAGRDPATICRTIDEHQVELLPTTPTFLTMLLLSSVWKQFSLASLRRITYGAEPMPPTVLAALAEALPQVDLKQTYGLSEVGILPTQSRERGSLWLKLGGGDVATRIVDGELWIRVPAGMLGYLNHPSPFTADGWFNTHDAVEIDGEYVRILGRASEIINVGGEKVYPAEVENVLLQADNVSEAAVQGRRNPITGQVVSARVVLSEPEPPREAERRLIAFCRARLAAFQVPMLIETVDGPLHNARGKIVRSSLRRAS